MQKISKKIRQDFLRYDPSIKIFISRTNLLKNLKEYQKKYPELLFAPVLKSNAYGHGLVQVAEILDKEKIAFFVVDSLSEAIILRNNGIRSEILIIGYTKPENIKNSRLSKIIFTVTSLEQLESISATISTKTNIHLKIDTGMHRQGILPDQIIKTVGILKSNIPLNLIGVCSHFADADNIDETFTKSQIKQWEKIVLRFQKEFPSIKYFHISATAGTSFSKKIGNVVRLGIGLYGVNPSPIVKLNLKPVLQMQSVISSLKKVKAGEYVGYNITYKAKRDSKIATVSAGYFEGVDRRLSNCGVFKIDDIYCPIVGKISMNITSIDVTSVPYVKFGDKVIIISDNTDDRNSVQNIAKLTQTIPWEIFVHIPQHLRRIVV